MSATSLTWVCSSNDPLPRVATSLDLHGTTAYYLTDVIAALTAHPGDLRRFMDFYHGIRGWDDNGQPIVSASDWATFLSCQPPRDLISRKLPWLFLDLDGVISPLDHYEENDPPPSKWREMSYLSDAPYGLWVARDMAQCLLALPAQMVWLTSWGETANGDMTRALNWPHLPVASFLTSFNKRRWESLREFIDAYGRRPFVWVEDGPNAIAGKRHLQGIGVPHLIIRPQRSVGITPAHYRRVREFLKAAAPQE